MDSSKLRDILNFVLRLVELARWPAALVGGLYLVLQIIKGV